MHHCRASEVRFFGPWCVEPIRENFRRYRCDTSIRRVTCWEEDGPAISLARIINTERRTLTPLIFSTTGGMGPEWCSRFNKRLAELRREGGSTHFLDKKWTEAYHIALLFVNSVLFTELKNFDHSSRYLRFRGATYDRNRTFLMYFIWEIWTNLT